jgi:histidinol-phosphate aminotransferase
VNDSGLKQLEQGFKRLKLNYIPSHANFIAVKFSNAMKIYNNLLKEGVIVRPVEMDNFLRISIGTTKENTYLLRALEKIL